jgi:disulfide bond formation protein DsbB
MLMMIRRPLAVFVLAVVVAGLAIVQSAQATGWWNMPGTFCQWNGCGYGGGYHAPLVLGPFTHECFEGPNEVRMRQAPNPYACAPCGDVEYSHARPAMTPTVQQHPEMVQPAANPEANRSSLIFNAPIQY